VDETFGVEQHRAPLAAFKDPRLSLLLPFWRTVVPIATTIVLVRDPVEVAASLAARKYAVPPAQSAGLWLRYLLAATANDPGHLLVRHSDLFDAFPETLGSIAAHVGVVPPSSEAIAQAREHWRPELHHHAPSASCERVDPLTALAEAVWNGG